MVAHEEGMLMAEKRKNQGFYRAKLLRLPVRKLGTVTYFLPKFTTEIGDCP
jgi:hypothetical protein